MRGKGALVLVIVSLLLSYGALFATDWQYFNIFNLAYGGYGTQIPSDYNTTFSTVFSYTPTRGALVWWDGTYDPTSRDWSTYWRQPEVWETGVYGLDGVDSTNSFQEILIQPRRDRAVLRYDLLSSSILTYIAAVRLTVWGSDDFDPNEDFAPLYPDDARDLFGVTDVEKHYYTGVQFYVERDDGNPVVADSCDVFDSTDVAAVVEPLVLALEEYDVEFTIPYDPTSATIHWAFDPVLPADQTLKWIQVGTEITPLGTYKKWQAIFPFQNPIAIPPQASWSGRNLPFKRIWVTFRSNGCHDCDAGDPLVQGIEGISVLDTFYVGMESPDDFFCYMDDAYQHQSIPPLGHVFVHPDSADPTNPMRERWASSEWIAGQDTIKPYIYELYPRNIVGSNGEHSDCYNVDGIDVNYGGMLTEHEWNSELTYPSNYDTPIDISDVPCGTCLNGTVYPYIYTADSLQVISFVAQDRQTCIDSVWVEIRYLNCGNYPSRVDTVFFRNPAEFAWDNQNGGHGTGWEENIWYDGNDIGCDGNFTGWGDYDEAWVEDDIDGCGVHRFWVAVGNDGPGPADDFLDPFIDGALVRVKVEVFNRNDHDWPFEYATHHDTSWQFIVDLSGPNASLVCPNNWHDGEEDASVRTWWQDDSTRAYRDYFAWGEPNYNRYDRIEGEDVPYVWIADSLPMFMIRVYDDYYDVHDTDNHGSTLNGAYGGSGFNLRDFEITFYIHRKASGEYPDFLGLGPDICPETGSDILRVTEEDLQPFMYCGEWVQGVYYDEDDNGRAGFLYVPFEHLFNNATYGTSVRPIGDRTDFMLESGDVVYVVFNMFFDDVDYGQHDDPATRADIDLYPSDSWCNAGGDDPNYGTPNTFDNHITVMPEPSTTPCVGYTDFHPDTVGIVRIDLKGPTAPINRYYPPHGWVTSDSFQVITCDLFDEIDIACVDNPIHYFEPKELPIPTNTSPRYYGVAGVNVDSIFVNIKVRGCDGSWHPEYNGVEGRNTWINKHPTGNEDPVSLPNLVIEKIRMHNADYEWWGTRVVYDPFYDPPGGGDRELKFRKGDEVCVTVYTCDNAYVPCVGASGYGVCDPFGEDGFEITGYYYDGTPKEYFPWDHYVQGTNWAEDVMDPDDLTLDPRQIARWTFYVDIDAPEFVVSDFVQCPLLWQFTIKDVSDRVGPIFCDEWVADVAAVDVFIETYDDEDCDGDGFNDWDIIFINDLPVGEQQLVYHGDQRFGYWTGYFDGNLDFCDYDPCCRDTLRYNRRLLVSLDEDLTDPERQAILTLDWYQTPILDTNDCHFWQPHDSVVVKIYAGDQVQVPWFPATSRDQYWWGPYFTGAGVPDWFDWGHPDDCYTWDGYLTDLGDRMAYQAYTSWRCENHNYISPDVILFDDILDYTTSGLTYEVWNKCDYENPNWAPVHMETQIFQREVYVDSVDWYNDDAYLAWNAMAQYTYPPDLHGAYSDYSTVAYYPNVSPEDVVDTDEADAILAAGSSLFIPTYTTDQYTNFYARDLNWIKFRIQSCSDSIVWECRPHDTLLINFAPYARLVLFDDTGAEIWRYEDWYDCDCIHCWLHYRPLRDGLYPPTVESCIDGGELIMGPLDQLVFDIPDTIRDSVFFMDTLGVVTFQYAVDSLVWGWPALRDVEYEMTTLASTPAGDTIMYEATPVYGYQHGDSLVVVTRFATRGPNQFTVDMLADYHYYAWSYVIDMMPPTGHFTSLVATTGYEEVNCYERHATNNTIRVRLESINDAHVGCSFGGTDPYWTTTWPLPAIVDNSDILHYQYHPYLDESLGLRYNPGTYYLYTNESMLIHNCADELIPASIMDLVDPITLYHGVDPGEDLVEDGVVFETDITADTIFIADSLWAEAILQDRLGNVDTVVSYPMGLDNGLPEVKGIAFCTHCDVGETLDMQLDTVMTDPLIIDTTLFLCEYGFNCWDPGLFRLPWEIPDQDSLIGVFNFSPPDSVGSVCTVYVRIWFTDNMDMRDINPLYGHIVRFKPDGWTHWFPIIPIDAHAGFYPLAEIYADYKQVDGGPVYRAAASDDPSDSDYETPSTMDIEPGWNSDREWIGFMVIAGDELMDGIATLRIQGFDDNAGNTMLDHEYPFRVETRYHPPIVGWPTPDWSDDTENDSWEGPYNGGDATITGYHDGDPTSCWDPWEEVPFCNEITGFDFDPTITDSVKFIVWYHDSQWVGGDVPEPGTAGDSWYMYEYVIDDMGSGDVWYDPATDYWYAQIPCDSFDVTDIPSPDAVSYFTVEFMSCSRFYPMGYVADTLLNTWINNRDLHCYPTGGPSTYLTDAEDGDITQGIDTLVFQVTTDNIRIVLAGEDVEFIDLVTFILVDELTLAEQMITSPDGINPGAIPVTDYLSDTTAWFDAANSVIIWNWDCEGKLQPGYYYLRYIVVDGIAIATGVTSPTGYDMAYHKTCCTRHSILIPREALLARGDNFVDAMMRTSCNYPTQPWADDIYPWENEDHYPDYPGWTSVDTPIVEDHEHLDRFQITTFTNPDWTSGDMDPFLRAFTEQGGYPGDSLYILFEIFPKDSLIEYVDMTIQDEYGGDISGSNYEINLTFYMDSIPDLCDTICVLNCLGEYHCYLMFNWVVDDQDNRYDGPVEFMFTTYERLAGAGWGTPAIPTNHPTYILLDTYDPEYGVELRRIHPTAPPMRICNNDDMPGEDIWVCNADTVDIFVDWYQTVFDQAPGDEDYTSYNGYVAGRTWNHMRMTIDGQPHHGYHTSDPNDLMEARLWHNVYDAGDVWNPFWHQPDLGYNDPMASPAPFATMEEYFADNRFRYRWTVASDPAGNGLAMILVKGRDVAGNILDYDEAELSRSIGKFVLIDTDPPTIDGDLVNARPSSFDADLGAITDNLLGGGYYDPVYLPEHIYVEATVYDETGTTVLGGPYPVNEDGTVDHAVATIGTDTLVLVCATDLAGNEDCILVPVEPEEECCEWVLCEGWNLVSFSTIPSDMNRSTWFGTWPAYINRGGVYEDAPDPLIPDYGYLVLTDSAATIEVCGAPLEALHVDDLLASWNTIGSPWDGADVATDILTDPAGALDPSLVYTFNCASGEYVATSVLTACRGHLVWLDVDCDSLWIDGSKVITVVKKRGATALWSAKLNVAGDGVTRVLQTGVAENGTEGFDNGVDAPALPAMPDGKDIYLGNHLAADYRSEDSEISWMVHANTSFNLTTDLSEVPEEYDLFIDDVNLRDVDDIVIKPGTHEVIAKRRAVPTEFALKQNCPNPFNAATVINFDLPEKCDVGIDVFDLSGQKVRTLVSGAQEAGYKSIVWEGNNDAGTPVASGVYFYRIKAGSFSETRRMILSK